MKSGSAGLLAMIVLLTPLASATTWYANGVSGNDNNNCLSETTACKTIGHAISLAASGDTINVAAATYTENLTIPFSLRFIGSGAKTTIIDGGGVGRVITISNTAAQVNLSKVTIQHGLAVTGGGISNAGTLTVSNSIVSGNRVYATGFLFPAGGGISNSGTLTINKSTLTGNIASTGSTAAFGGGIYGTNNGTVIINASTLAENSASGSAYHPSGSGGGIFIISGVVLISNSTITKNGASAQGGGIWGRAKINNSTISGNSAPSGGGIYGTATLQNSIVANSVSGANCVGTIISDGYNLSSDSSCNLTGPGDLNNTDPMLGPLQNNGGPTQTMALPSGSPAIDAGNPTGCIDSNGHLLKTDQRGFPRPDPEEAGGCDMGAYESQSD
jgi:hypothetical protein